MRIGQPSESAHSEPTVVVIGNFDGVHLGHRAVLRDSSDLARNRGLSPVAMTFDPHPTVIVGRPPPACLTSLQRKVELIERIDPSLRVVVQPFDAAFALQSPEAFVRDILVSNLRAVIVRVGENFRFGANRAGDLNVLRELGEAHGFEAQAETLIGDSRGRYSSTRARRCVLEGDLAEARNILGRPHSLSGRVVKGQMRARELGFPTANLAWIPEAIPPHGVYSVAVDQTDESGRAERLGLGVANIGVRPTVDAGFAVEVHVVDLEQDLYGTQLRVHLLSFLRPERKFAGIHELKPQVEADVRAARSLLQIVRPEPDAGQAWF